MSPPRTSLVIVGAGGLARETVAAVRAIDAVSPTWDLLGYVDDDPQLLGRVIDGLPVLGSIDSLARAYLDAQVVICTGRPGAPLSRRSINERLGFGDDRYASIVHPSASLAPGTKVGTGSIILAQVAVTTPLVIGRHVVVMPQVVFTHDDVIGDHSTFASGVCLGGSVTIGEGAYLGAGALVREQVTIGAGALIGMGAVVVRDVPSGETWVGNPAKKLRPSGGSQVHQLQMASGRSLSGESFGALGFGTFGTVGEGVGR